MPIYIAESSEPFATTPLGGQVVLAESAAYVRLCSELYRYVAGEISGRSFLISGHRGAGKTTLVLKSIEDTARQATGITGVQPLLISLHGPDLLAPSAATTAEGARETSAAGKEKEVPPLRPATTAATAANDTQEFLRQVTIGFYRALADLFHLAYWRVAEWKANTNAALWRDLPEMAAQLRVELDGAPDLSLLREYWRKADALADGILVQAGFYAPPTMPPQSTPPPGLPERRDRGMLELVALSSAAEAYKVVRGRLETKEGSKQDDSSKSSLAFQTVGEVKNLLNPLLGALAGGAVGLALKSAEVSTVLSALAGTATGLGTAVTLNYSSSRSRESVRSKEVTFLPDTTIASLDRTLPLLVSRCRQAGVAPVFVVDELDKVSQLAERMGPLVRHLKSLVTEKSFFCFLADRSYLEGLRRSLVATPYRTEYTYFSDRLFVLYRPGDLHKYLGNLLQTRGTTDPSEAIDLEVLRYVLLHRSRLHPFDLRRQLSRIRGGAGEVSIPSGVVRTELAYRFDVLIQVAVEWLLQQPELRERLTQDEDFTQLVYDTLYYPSRMWEQGSAELDVSRDTFFRYLGERMSPSLGVENDGAAKPAGNDCPLSALDKEFLYSRLRQLVSFLTDPARLKDAISSDHAKMFPTSVVEAIPADAKFRLLENNRPDSYTWRRDVFGRSVEPQGVEVVISEFKPRHEFIMALQAALNDIGPGVNLDRLAAEYNVLSATPAWNSVQQALNRLKRLSENRQPYSEMESDSNAVWEYHQMLQGSGSALAQSLVAARVFDQLARWGETGLAPNEQTIIPGLQFMTETLALRRLSLAETRQILGRVMTELQSAFPWLTFEAGKFDLTSTSATEWATALKAALNNPTIFTINRPSANQFAAGAEKKWLDRLTQFFQSGTTVFEPAAADLICGAASMGVSGLLGLDLSEESIFSWTYLACQSLTDLPDPSRAASAVFGVAALFQMGFGREIIDCINNGRMFQQPWPKFAKLLEYQSTIQNWMSSAGGRMQDTSVKPGVIVVLMPLSPLGLDWKPSAKYPAAVVDQGNLGALRQALQGIWNPALISRVIIELNPAHPLNAQVNAQAATMNAQAATNVLAPFPELAALPFSYISRTAPTPPVTGLPLVISPKTLDEAVDLATPLMPQTTKAATA